MSLIPDSLRPDSVYDALVLGLTICVTFGVVLATIALGWFIVWKCFLSRFQFIQEILSSDEKDENYRALREQRRQSAKRKLRIE